MLVAAIPIEHMNMPAIVVNVSRNRHQHEEFYESKLPHFFLFKIAKINIFISNKNYFPKKNNKGGSNESPCFILN